MVQPGGHPEGRWGALDPQRLGRTYASAAVQGQRARTRELLGVHPGERLLDLGCGPGQLSTELATEVGRRGAVVGLDRAAGMVRSARQRALETGVGQRCSFAQADATALPLADASCDAAVVVQVLEYVPDVAGALRELHRVLRPGGRAVVVDTDWRSCVWHTGDRERCDTVLRLWEAHFVHPHLPAQLAPSARGAGFAGVEVYAVPLVETRTHTDTYSVGMAGTIAAFVGQQDPELAAGWLEDVRRQAAEDTYFFSLTRCAAVLTR